MVKFLSIALVAITLMSSCSNRLIDFTVISSKNVSLKIDKSQGKHVEGSSMGFLGLGISIKDAMDKALSSAGADYDLIVDGVVRENDYVLMLGYTVEGTAISSSKLKAQLGEKGFEDFCKANNILDPNTAKASQN